MRPIICRWLPATAIVLCLPPLGAWQTPSNPPEKPVDFNRDVRPILSDACFACHGPEEGSRQGNLRLDTTESVFGDRDGYRIIVPGNSAASRLYQRISAKERRMPPASSGRTLTPKEIELIRDWIDQGAKWQSHWAFDPLKRPATPEVKDRNWPRNPIDYFTLARLEAEGLKPSFEADKATLLRRVAFDLTGLPPTPAEVDSFMADHSPDAYDLAGTHHGLRPLSRSQVRSDQAEGFLSIFCVLQYRP